jgi:hypothetical protein
MQLSGTQPLNEATTGSAAGADETAANTATGAHPDANSNLTVDFGFFEPYALGNEVWFDDDDDGIRDAGESAAPGVTVRLLDATATTVLATTTTDASGRYVFDDLRAGTYVVEVAASNFAAAGPLLGARSSTGQAGDNQVDGNDNGAHVGAVTTAVRSTPIVLSGSSEPTGENPTSTTSAVDDHADLTVDFGFVRPASLGNFVWEDLDGDGVQDAGEPGIAGLRPDGAGPRWQRRPRLRHRRLRRDDRHGPRPRRERPVVGRGLLPAGLAGEPGVP